MAFFQRIVSYVVNELLVNRLANSTTFQRFAIKTDAAMKELQQKGTKHVSSGGEALSQGTSQFRDFTRAFAEELTKGLRDMPKGK